MADKELPKALARKAVNAVGKGSRASWRALKSIRVKKDEDGRVSISMDTSRDNLLLPPPDKYADMNDPALARQLEQMSDEGRAEFLRLREKEAERKAAELEAKKAEAEEQKRMAEEAEAKLREKIAEVDARIAELQPMVDGAADALRTAENGLANAQGLFAEAQRELNQLMEREQVLKQDEESMREHTAKLLEQRDEAATSTAQVQQEVETIRSRIEAAQLALKEVQIDPDWVDHFPRSIVAPNGDPAIVVKPGKSGKSAKPRDVVFRVVQDPAEIDSNLPKPDGVRADSATLGKDADGNWIHHPLFSHGNGFTVKKLTSNGSLLITTHSMAPKVAWLEKVKKGAITRYVLCVRFEPVSEAATRPADPDGFVLRVNL